MVSDFEAKHPPPDDSLIIQDVSVHTMGLISAAEYKFGELAGVTVLFVGVAMLGLGGVIPGLALILAGIAVMPSIPITGERKIDLVIFAGAFIAAYTLLPK